MITRAGDSGVGLKDAFPQPKRDRLGSSTKTAIQDNADQLFDPNWLNCRSEDSSEYETWMLLVYRSGDLIRYELSLPSGIDEYDRVLGWIERIILEPLDLSDVIPKAPLEESGEEIDVQVSPKR